GWSERFDAIEQMNSVDVLAFDPLLFDLHDHVPSERKSAVGKRSHEVVIRDPPRPIQPSEFVVRQISPAFQETLGFLNRLLEGKMLQAVQRVGMDEGADGALGVQDLSGVCHLRAQAMPLGVRDDLTVPDGFVVASPKETSAPKQKHP